MDDYILKILQAQEEDAQNTAEERLLTAMEMEAVPLRKEETVGQIHKSDMGTETVSGKEQQKKADVAEHPGAEMAISREQDKTLYPERMLFAMEMPEVHRQVTGEKTAQAAQYGHTDTDYRYGFAVIGEKNTEIGMEPEELSRFFQRDARRFS